ncbi:nuclear transport factor 2 family protein [Sphingomonas baiyangensis]|uniref:Nuclear transport factor 2 family protein n=1 Tax=Sphingomonas baiyangensis TaxID=2572576 RepID=A0A4U1L1E9_9SPHN|nr:nuclear transport factor 2 family protein [Sphingomonas baiyangensis]TKD50667.1 nuclear transport factor 2 family protein [Sphingomonas baiyangensis]
MLDYAQYIATFCTGEDDRLVDTYFADDVTFTGGTRQHHGKEGLRSFLKWAHGGVREVPRVQSFLQSEELILAEIDMDFHATQQRRDFPFGDLDPGDSVTVKFLVSYRIANDKIVELKSMTWPPEKGVTKLPKLGGHPSQIAAFHAYCAAFSNADYDRFSSFYTDDVVLELGSVPPIHGKDGITGFYRKMFAVVRENITVHSVLADDRSIALDATARFTAQTDAPDFVVGPIAAGEYIEVRVFVHYELEGGLVRHIRVGRAGSEGAPRFFHADGTRKA